MNLEISKDFAQYEERVARLNEEPLERVIWRLIEQEGLEEEDARMLRVEFLRFFSLAFMTDQVISPSPLVDKFWHAFILHTRDYDEFCKKHLGHFFHHEPRDHTKKNDKAGNPAPGIFTKQMIEKTYPNFNQRVWAETAICSNSHCDHQACVRM